MVVEGTVAAFCVQLPESVFLHERGKPHTQVFKKQIHPLLDSSGLKTP